MKPSIMIKPLSGILFSFLFICTTIAQDKLQERIQSSAKVLDEFGKMKESIPSQLLQQAEGIIIIPKLINAGLVVGGKRGRGIALAKGSDGSWSNPVFLTMTAGSIGFQVGVQSIDLVLVFLHRETLDKIGNGSFTLGGDISVAAGPVGRNSSASTDYKFEAEVYSYSRSRGLFAGISLSGSALAVDAKANSAFYGEDLDAKTLFSGETKNSSAEVMKLKKSLQALYGK